MFNRVAKVITIVMRLKMIIIFKVGSQTLIKLLRGLGQKNRFNVSVFYLHFKIGEAISPVEVSFLLLLKIKFDKIN